MTEQELLELWRKLPQDRQTQLAAILQYVVECDREMRGGQDTPLAQQDSGGDHPKQGNEHLALS